MTKLTKGDLVRSLHNDQTLYTVLANKNGWLTVRVAHDPLNADLVYVKQRANLFARCPVYNPRPAPDYANSSREAYLAGYGDAIRHRRFDGGAYGAFSTYRDGWSDGVSDRTAA
jgi:hypothetical protein